MTQPLIDDPIDWEIDRNTWDVIIPLRRVRGAKAVAQRIAILLRMIRGEWFADLARGMPWFAGNGVDTATAILGQPFAEVKTRAEVRKIILSVPGVAAIERLVVKFDRKGRRLTIDWRCTTIWGDTAADKLSLTPTKQAA